MPRLAVLFVAGCAALALVGAGCSADPEPGATRSPSAPATTPVPAPGDHALTLASGGNTYKYLLHAPPGYDASKRLPLVIALHFYPGTGAQIRETTALDVTADREGFL